MELSDILAGIISQGGAKDLASVIDFIESSWGLNQRLFPVQRVIIKAHYGIPLDDYSKSVSVSDWKREKTKLMTEADYLKLCFDEGRSNIREVLEGNDLREVILAWGRRSGKTQIAAAISAYETYKLLRRVQPQKYYGLNPLETIKISGVATGREQAAIFFNKASGYFKACPFFQAYAANDTKTYMTFQTESDINFSGRWSRSSNQNAKSSILLNFMPCTAKGLRGAGNILVILDEFAFFEQEREDLERQNSDQKVYDAITPSLAAFSPKDPNDSHVPIGPVEGRLIAISSPNGKEGLFYKKFQEGFSGSRSSKNMLCFRAPTWEVNPTIPADHFAKEMVSLQRKFWTEYGSEFSDRASGWIERQEDLIACVNPKRARLWQAPARRPHFVGFDLGMSHDASAIAISHVDTISVAQTSSSVVELDFVDEMRAGKGANSDKEMLDFDEIAEWIWTLSRKFSFASGLADQNLGIPLIQALNKRGLTMFESRIITKTESTLHFKNFKDMMYSGQLSLYGLPKKMKDDGSGEAMEFPDYIYELLDLQAEVKSKNITVVSAPKVQGKSDDQSDALVRSIWLASQQLLKSNHIIGASAGASSGTVIGGSRGQYLAHNAVRNSSHGTGSRRLPSPRRTRWR